MSFLGSLVSAESSWVLTLAVAKWWSVNCIPFIIWTVILQQKACLLQHLKISTEWKISIEFTSQDKKGEGTFLCIIGPLAITFGFTRTLAIPFFWFHRIGFQSFHPWASAVSWYNAHQKYPSWGPKTYVPSHALVSYPQRPILLLIGSSDGI